MPSQLTTKNTPFLHRKRTVGFTLVEMIVAITVISIALAATMSVFSLTVSSSADPIQPKQAMLVAESMLEEILLKPYANPDGGYVAACTTTCDRARFDDVKDYHNYASNGVYALDDLSTRVAGLEAYAVSVTVADSTTTANANTSTGQRVTVTVSVGGNAYTLTGYRFNYD